MIHNCLSTRIKTARFAMPLKVLENFQDFCRLQNHPKKILRRASTAHKARRCKGVNARKAGKLENYALMCGVWS